MALVRKPIQKKPTNGGKVVPKKPKVVLSKPEIVK
jgi:hypothetical protein